MNDNKSTPYELIQGDGPNPFITFKTRGVQESWPWHAITGIQLKDLNTELRIEFGRQFVEITGENLGVIETEARRTRLKILREGASTAVTIKSIRIVK